MHRENILDLFDFLVKIHQGCSAAPAASASVPPALGVSFSGSFRPMSARTVPETLCGPWLASYRARARSVTRAKSARLRMIVGRMKISRLVFSNFPVELRNNQPSYGKSPKPGIFDSERVSPSLIKPPNTTMSSFPVTTVVFSSRLKVMIALSALNFCSVAMLLDS